MSRRGRRSDHRGKTFTSQSLIGQAGINLIERITLEMNCLWRPLVGPDIGIDGHIELCDQATGESLHHLIAVQSRATAETFAGETETTIEYVCDERDLNYWLQGNLPVLLIRSRPKTDEAYWISVKDYFADPKRRASRKVVFGKQRDRFDQGVYAHLLQMAAPAGAYLAPIPKLEKLITNLLPVASWSPRIYVGDTEYRDPKDLWEKLRQVPQRAGREWILRDKKLISFLDLRESPWPEVCDRGNVEDFETEEWATSDDPDRLSEFIQLIKWALRCRLGPQISWDHDLELFFFPARTISVNGQDVLTSYSAEYNAPTRRSSRTVFEVYRRDDGKPKYCRHYAFVGAFRRHDGQWFLEVNPTYHFTYDGYRPSFWADNLVSGIKRLERNPAVLASLRLWAQTIGRRAGLFSDEEYPHLSFGELVTLEVDAGINDRAWQQSEDAGERQVLESEENRLFEAEQ